MMRRGFGLGALAVSMAVACGPPPEKPPPIGAPNDAAVGAGQDTGTQSAVTCSALGGRCVDPGGKCPIQIAGKDPCGSADGSSSSQICCAGE